LVLLVQAAARRPFVVKICPGNKVNTRQPTAIIEAAISRRGRHPSASAEPDWQNLDGSIDHGGDRFSADVPRRGG
jgi:hypothetical protein